MLILTVVSVLLMSVGSGVGCVGGSIGVNVSVDCRLL